jgi:Glycosyltransferase family 87
VTVTEGAPPWEDRPGAWFGILWAGLVAIALLAAVDPLIRGTYADLQLYQDFGQRVLDGKRPYADFEFPYPPLSLGPMLLPFAAGQGGGPPSHGTYVLVFAVAMAAGASALIVLVGTLVRRAEVPAATLRVAFVAVPVLLAHPLVVARFDVLPALLTGLALWFTVAGRPALAGIGLGLGIALKLYPLALLPAFAVAIARRQGPTAWIRLVAVAGAVAAAALLPFAALWPPGPLGLLTLHAGRGPQIESVPGGLLLLANLVTGGGAGVELAGDVAAWSVAGPASGFAAALSTTVAVMAYAVVMVITIRALGRAERHTVSHLLPTASAAALLVLLATSRVFSPQYLVWLLPFVAFLRPASGLLFAVVVAASVVVYPFLYLGLVDLQPVPILALVLRNVLLAVLALWVVADLARAAPPVGER